MGFLIVDTSGLDLLRARFQLAHERIPAVVQEELDILGVDVVGQLADAAPKGSGEGPPPPGDAEGPLAESFTSEIAARGTGATVRVSTTQPTKLKFVREGRGEVFPLHPKAALYWQGLDHPVMHAGPSEPNDFVTPIVIDAAATAAQLVAEAVSEEITLL